MATAELLQAEARERPRMAIAAGVAALFTLAAPVIGGLVLADAPDNLPGSALYRHEHQAGLALSAACSVIGLLAIVLVLDFLYRSTRARTPELPALLRPLPWIGGLGLAAVSIGFQIVSAVKLGHFATESTFTYDEAKAAADPGALAYVGLVAQLAFALAFVMIAINAMRAGLLTRFLGYLGVISAALFVLAFLPIPIVQVYWLGALAVLFAGRSSRGLPPAWQSGEAMPWPSAAEMREARVRAAEERRMGGVAEPAAGEPEAGETGSAASRRKKRKRR